MPSKIKSPRTALSDIAANIRLACDIVAGLDHEAFAIDQIKSYAVVRCLEIISEASRRLPQEMRDRHPQTPWREIAAAGNFYRHEYEGIESIEIWDVVRQDLPALLVVIEAELKMLPKE